MKNLLFCSFLFMLVLSCSKDENLTPEISFKEEQSSILKGPNGSNGNKVDVCHKGKIINVSINAVPAHQAHGDAVDMDGDGYFNIENDCGPTDCDDSNAELTDICNVCPQCPFGEYLSSLDLDGYCYKIKTRHFTTSIVVYDKDTGSSIGNVRNGHGRANYSGWNQNRAKTSIECYVCASEYIISNFSECQE